MQKIVFTNPDGSVGIIIPTGELPIEEVMKKDVPVGATNARYIDDVDLPQDRMFRNAWDDSNPEQFIGVDMVKVGEIAHEKRRAKRDEVFAPNLEVLNKNAMGIPLVAGEDAIAASTANASYKADVDDVAQTDIDAAVVAGDEVAVRATLTGLGIEG